MSMRTITITIVLIAILLVLAVAADSSTTSGHDNSPTAQTITVRCRLPWQPVLMYFPDGTRQWTCMFIWRR